MVHKSLRRECYEKVNAPVDGAAGVRVTTFTREKKGKSTDDRKLEFPCTLEVEGNISANNYLSLCMCQREETQVNSNSDIKLRKTQHMAREINFTMIVNL